MMKILFNACIMRHKRAEKWPHCVFYFTMFTVLIKLVLHYLIRNIYRRHQNSYCADVTYTNFTQNEQNLYIVMLALYTEIKTLQIQN